MLQDRQEIAEKIRDGSYFKDANEWYAGKYLYPVTERSLVFLFAVISFFTFLPIASLLNDTVQTNNKIPFPIIVADSTEHFSVIKPLAQKDESAQIAVAKYLITDYIKSREEYIHKNIDGEKLKRLLKKIKSSSAKTVLNEYVSYMSESNTYSPLVRYKDHTDRLIEVKSISFLDNDQTSGKANVVFEATEKTNGGKKQTSMWEVEMSFRLPDVATIARTGAPLRFLVGYYMAKPLDNNAKQDIKTGDKAAAPQNKTEAEPKTPPEADKKEAVPAGDAAETEYAPKADEAAPNAAATAASNAAAAPAAAPQQPAGAESKVDEKQPVAAGSNQEKQGQ